MDKAPHPIIVDCDPGDDDAVALLLALASPELDVLGVTVVAGNAPLPDVLRNARAVCELAGCPGTRVFRGADRPLLRPLLTAEAVHGEGGLAIRLPEPGMPVETLPADRFLVEAVMARPPGTVTLCCLGPLTNAALALAAEPGIAERLAGIVLMGGSWFQGGNTTPVAEFNAYVDPDAADLVFRSGARITVLPLDCTHQALITPARVDRLRALGTPVGDAAADILGLYSRFDAQRYGIEGGPLHDPLVIAWLLRPDLFQGKDVHVAVETASELTMGATVMDWWGRTGKAPNATVLHRVDAQGFFDLLSERLARYPA